MATSVIPEAKFVSAGLAESDLVFRRLKGVEALGELPESPSRSSLAEAIGYVMDRRS